MRSDRYTLNTLEQERQQKEAAQGRAEQLAERLRQMGINPDEV